MNLTSSSVNPAYETEIRGSRVSAGQAAAMARGKTWGGSKLGARKNKVASKVKSILALVEQGISKAMISRTVGVSIPTIYSVIKEYKKGDTVVIV